MCGLCGFVDTAGNLTEERAADALGRMSARLAHRGPDDSGAWFDPAAGVGFGFRRLSIIDTSPLGHQPMESHDGRYVIVYNGEVYNFLELKAELERLGHTYRGHSDTEVMLAAMSKWGVPAAVKRFNGMFAIAVFDRAERRLHLVRDRIGKKPLYYGWAGKTLLFGSELKALAAHPDFEPRVDRDSLAAYLRYAYVHAPYSIYDGIRKVPQACIVTFDVAGLAPGTYPAPEPYWNILDVAREGAVNPYPGTRDEADAELENLLSDSVKRRMISDVPLGAFLSGGIDSSLVVALMQAQSGIPVRTFTIGFAEEGYDEAGFAREVARHIGTDHTDLYVTPEDTMAALPLMPAIYDEPFADSSQIPTYLVSRLARAHVTVCLSGDGGDETFAGYNSYATADRIWSKVGGLPRWLKRMSGALITAVPERVWLKALSPFSWGKEDSLRPRNPGRRLYIAAEILGCNTAQDMHIRMYSRWTNPDGILVSGSEPATSMNDGGHAIVVPELIRAMMYRDMRAYLPDDILVKVDRASMSVSLEARCPLLDHRVIEFSFALPMSFMYAKRKGKTILRRLLYKHVPRELIERPKRGFAIPVGTWIKGPLREWAESLLSEERLLRDGFIHPAPVRAAWKEHLDGIYDNSAKLWTILMFQAWLDENRGAT